eukprot:3865131-Prymnesium_polylepis.1
MPSVFRPNWTPHLLQSSKADCTSAIPVGPGLHTTQSRTLHTPSCNPQPARRAHAVAPRGRPRWPKDSSLRLHGWPHVRARLHCRGGGHHQPALRGEVARV